MPLPLIVWAGLGLAGVVAGRKIAAEKREHNKIYRESVLAKKATRLI